MANTSYLVKVVEPFLVEWVGRRIGKKLAKRRVVVGKNSEGRDVPFEFDGVSEDETVGVCASSSSSYKVGQMRKFFMEAALLNRVPYFQRRIMVFTSEHVWEGFKSQCDGLVDLHRIEPMICNDLPQEMRDRIEEIYQRSAAEVGDKSGPGRRVPRRRGTQ